jgi:hypothetical protein
MLEIRNIISIDKSKALISGTAETCKKLVGK